MGDLMTISSLHIGVLALQGAFSEHIQLLRKAAATLPSVIFSFAEIRTKDELENCDALIIPGGESTTISLVAARSGLLNALRDFVKVKRRPTWGTCAGLILLAESANRTKKGGQELIGGLDVRVNRNHFGRQTESFTQNIRLPFLADDEKPFHAVFIRAPVVEKVLKYVDGIQSEEAEREDTVVAPTRRTAEEVDREVKVLAGLDRGGVEEEIIAVRQGNCFGMSFHPELTNDARIHVWWLREIVKGLGG